MALVSQFTGEQAAAEAAMRLRAVAAKIAALRQALLSYPGPNWAGAQIVAEQVTTLANNVKTWVDSSPSKTALGNLFRVMIVPGYPLGVGILTLVGQYKTDADKYGTAMLQQVLNFEKQSDALCSKTEAITGTIAGCRKLAGPLVPKEKDTLIGKLLWYGFLAGALYIGGKWLLSKVGHEQRHPSPPRYAR